MGDIGRPVRRIEFEPLPETAPAPVEPLPTPAPVEPVKVPEEVPA